MKRALGFFLFNLFVYVCVGQYFAQSHLLKVFEDLKYIFIYNGADEMLDLLDVTLCFSQNIWTKTESGFVLFTFGNNLF